MGGCIGQPRTLNFPSRESSDASGTVSVGRNQPLRPEKPRWKSDVPITEGQLRSRRDEFWDTAPAFEGHREIWDALKAAAYALETGDQQLAQAIIDGANISVPTGSLVDCYDELGIRYQLPVYVLSSPTNMIDEASELPPPQPPSSSLLHSSSKRKRRGVEIPIRLVLSTGRELKLTVHTTDTIFQVKRQIQMMEKISPARCRLFFAGRLLVDRMRVKDAKICKNYTVQVVVADSPPATVAASVDSVVLTTAPAPPPPPPPLPTEVEVHQTS